MLLMGVIACWAPNLYFLWMLDVLGIQPLILVNVKIPGFGISVNLSIKTQNRQTAQGQLHLPAPQAKFFVLVAPKAKILMIFV